MWQYHQRKYSAMKMTIINNENEKSNEMKKMKT